jgi:hypothetical protein
MTIEILPTSPRMRVRYAHTAQEDVRVPICAELAASRCVRVEVTAYCVDIGLHILAAGLSRWRVKSKVFITCAGDFLICHTSAEHSLDKVR